jgi:DNA-binding response OmpR family regulator
MIDLPNHAGPTFLRPTMEITAYAAAEDGKRIVLAEDDGELRTLLAQSLRRSGYVVLTATNGADALALFSTFSNGRLPKPNAIVMDVRMPRHSGLELLVAVRLAEWQIPVVLITGFGDELTHQRAMDYGAFAILDKPLKTEELILAVNQAIGSRLLVGGAVIP